MVGSIDPRCETVRGTHWPKPGRVVVWNSRRGNHLGQRSKPTASTGRTYGCKRSDQTFKKTLAARGPSRDDPLRDCANGRRFRPLAGHGDFLLNLARLIVIGFALNPCNIPSNLEPTRPA